MDQRYYLFIIIGIGVLICLLLLLYERFIRDRISKSKSDYSKYQKLRQDNLALIRNELQEAETRQMQHFQPAAQPLTDISQPVDTITGRIHVDTMLQKISDLCAEKQVTFICHINRIPELSLPEAQIISLFSNLLLNAVEAAEKVQGTVHCESRLAKGQWVLTVENSKLTSVSPLKSGMRTTKSGSGHGLGTGIIDAIVRTADGYIHRSDTGDTFKVFIAIPV